MTFALKYCILLLRFLKVEIMFTPRREVEALMFPELIYSLPLAVLSVLFGLIMGSFLNCLAWRLVHGESVMKGRSHCAACGHVLGPRDLVPLLSWLFLKGRCRYCGEPVSVRYPLAELICGVMYGTLAWRYGFSVETLRFLLLFSLLLAVSLVDLEDGWVPDRFLVIGAAGYLLLLFLEPEPMKALMKGLIGAAALFFPLLSVILAADKLLGQESMGGGDLKLFALLGLYFGWKQGLLLVILSCFTGLVFAAVAGKARPGMPFPFVPAMTAAAWLTAMWGEPVIRWYLSLFY